MEVLKGSRHAQIQPPTPHMICQHCCLAALLQIKTHFDYMSCVLTISWESHFHYPGLAIIVHFNSALFESNDFACIESLFSINNIIKNNHRHNIKYQKPVFVSMIREEEVSIKYQWKLNII